MGCGPFEYSQPFAPRPVLAALDAVLAVMRLGEEMIPVRISQSGDGLITAVPAVYFERSECDRRRSISFEIKMCSSHLADANAVD
jgi:hypothetical protein